MKRTIVAAVASLALATPAVADCGTFEQQLAHNFVKQHVKEQLRSPKKADFPFTPTEKVLTRAGAKCVVVLRSWVDAPNAFGTEVRSTYIAEVEVTGKKAAITTFGFID
jgi:hypothetical protein